MNNIRQYREQLGWTIKDLAEQIDVHYTTVSEWELGKITPRPKRKKVLAQLLGQSLDVLFPPSNFPKANYEGMLSIGDKQIDCAVLENGKRILSRAAVFDAFGRPRRGEMPSREYDGLRLPSFLDAKNVRIFITEEVMTSLQEIEYLSKSGHVRWGYDATVIPLICDVYLAARHAKVLTSKQVPLAEVSELIVRSLSKIGIVALVDEATGYQQDRDRQELNKLLAKYLSEERLAWAKRFPDEFFKQLYRLRNWDYPTGNSRTPLVGKLINKLVYDQLPSGVLEELQKKNPTVPETKRRKWKHHQFLSEDLGRPDLRDHLLQVIALMRGSPNWTSFEKTFNLAFPTKGSLDFLQEELDLDLGEE